MSTLRIPARQRGLTLIEFMVSITIGMLMVAALATLIADQSSNRNEVDKSGRLIENGRYAIRTIADDLQMAGYWGELTNMPAMPAALPDPCSATLADVQAAMPLHIQGYAPPAATATSGYNRTTNPAVALGCLLNRRPGTDVLVVRHADPDSSDVETGGVVDAGKVTADRIYLQTGLQAVGTAFTYKMDTGSNFATTFDLLKKDKATKATLRKAVVRIYYVTDCSVCSGSGADTIPSLKMRELTTGPALGSAITIAEGVENLQIDYGLDTDGDGAPDGADLHANAVGLAQWPDVMTVRINLLVRSPETSPGFADDKTYDMGPSLAPNNTTAATNDGYRRHVFVQSVRLVNPSARRVS